MLEELEKTKEGARTEQRRTSGALDRQADSDAALPRGRHRYLAVLTAHGSGLRKCRSRAGRRPVMTGLLLPHTEGLPVGRKRWPWTRKPYR